MVVEIDWLAFGCTHTNRHSRVLSRSVPALLGLQLCWMCMHTAFAQRQVQAIALLDILAGIRVVLHDKAASDAHAHGRATLPGEQLW